MTEFDGVVPALGQTLAKRGYDTLTQVQQAVLAPELRDADLLVSAQTGSGKTVAFGLALAPTLLADTTRFALGAAPLALIVAPTRELALQVKRELAWLYETAGASIASCVGGMDMRDERRALSRGAHIVVGTPGRLVDHLKRKSLDMSALQAVVLDEADEMLDLGFREDLETILAAAPKQRRTLMFSATVPRTIATLAKNYQRNAVRVSTVAEQKQHLDIDYRALTIAKHDQENAIINVLRFYEAKNALVFCATRATVNHMTSRFNNRGFSVVALSGELSQKERSHALQAMRDGRARVCVATDVAARGIDLPNLELVIHADLPRSADSLLHRSGRTGRAGRKGVSVLIVPHNARKQAQRLLANAKIKASWEAAPSAADVRQRDDERLLTDPTLSEQIKDSERELAQALLTRHGAEQVAAAYLRLHHAGKSAPEELDDAPPPKSGRETREPRKPRESQPRNTFDNGAWISLSVGRKKSAEPRWLLPLICKAGDLTKRDIGAIRVHEHHTDVELAPESIDRFFEAVGATGKLEKSIIATRLDQAPAAPGAPRGKPYGKKPNKPYKSNKPAAGGKWKPDADEPRADSGGPPKPGDKKFHKKKFAKAEARKRKQNKPVKKASAGKGKGKGKKAG